MTSLLFVFILEPGGVLKEKEWVLGGNLGTVCTHCEAEVGASEEEVDKEKGRTYLQTY